MQVCTTSLHNKSAQQHNMSSSNAPENAWRAKGGTTSLARQLSILSDHAVSLLQRSGVEQLVFPDRRVLLQKLVMEDPQDPNSVAQLLLQHMRTKAEKPVLAALKVQAQKHMTEEQLQAARNELADTSACASDAFRQAAREMYEAELAVRIAARSELARLSEAIRPLACEEELETFLQAQPEFPLKNSIRSIMEGVPLYKLRLEEALLTAVYALHFKQPLEELVLNTQRLCKEAVLQEGIHKIRYTFSFHWIDWVELSSGERLQCFTCAVDAVNLLYVWEMVYEQNMSVFCAHIKPACEEILRMPMNSFLSNETYKISLFVGLMEFVLMLQNKPATTAAAIQFLNTIVRKVILNDIIDALTADLVVFETIHLLTYYHMHILVAEEILPLFLHKVTSAQWSTASKAIKVLHNTSWSTTAMQMAVRQHVPPPPAKRNRRR